MKPEPPTPPLALAGAGSDWLLSYFNADYRRFVLEQISRERTERQVRTLLGRLPPPQAGPLLDLGCGLGRHALALAAHGYRVTGRDIVPSFVEAAQKQALEANLPVRFEVGDMRTLADPPTFAAVLFLWSSFGYFSDEENQATLDGTARALLPKGLLFLDLENRERILRHFQRDRWQRCGSGWVLERNRFLLMDDTLITRKIYLSNASNVSNGDRFHRAVGTDFKSLPIVLDNFGCREAERRLKLYPLATVCRMLNQAGLAVEEALGGEEGEPYCLESRRMWLVARRT
ncbi:MAG: methyltransferase domain-containing protein [Coprothermobacterota bacterium]|nr:methyltransferase domain-containing protein [Coprothermobacterota bacterium]